MFSLRLFTLSMQMTRRDWRAGELRLLAIALVLAVAAVTSVGFFVDRMRAGLQRDAAQLLGADAVVVSDAPLSAQFMQSVQPLGLRTAQVVTFPSMAISARDAELTALVAVKAVSEGYPLRGALRVAAAMEGPQGSVTHGPAPGTVWVDAALLRALQLQVGDALRLGAAQFRIERVIVLEPDRGMAFINFAPRLMLHLSDLPATGLVQPASRVTYRWLLAGERTAMREFSARWASRLERGQRLESVDSGRPEIARTLERAERFLSLVALLCALVAAVAVVAVARRFMVRHLDACALMRCLGLPQREMFALFAMEFLWLGVCASAAGVLLGWALHFVLLALLSSVLPTALPGPGLLPAVHGFVLGLTLLLGFALPPLAQLRQVPPLRVLRKDLGLPQAHALSGYALGLAALAFLLLWAAGDVKVGAVALAGFAAGVVVFALMGGLSLVGLRGLKVFAGLGMTWRFALASMLRRPTATVVQLMTLAVGLMALLLLTVVRTDLVQAWRAAAPESAPNRFIINIQPDQETAVAQRLVAAGVPEVQLHPMIRGRLIAINGNAVNPEQFESDRAQRLVDREFNLSYMPEAPSHNTVVQGRWFAPDAPELSIEEGIAKTLGVKLGDELTFQIGGVPVRARTTSVRKVSWDSMRANFFVIMSPALLQQQPRTLMTAFHLPAQASALPAALLKDFPNLTFIDTSAVFAQVQAVVEQVVRAVEFLFVFTLLSGVLVLYAALAATHDERVREAALLRALGARRAQLLRVQVVELLFLGALAGVLAALGASAVGWALARFAFELSYTFSVWPWVAGVVAGGACAVLAGAVGLRRVLATPPLISLREG